MTVMPHSHSHNVNSVATRNDTCRRKIERAEIIIFILVCFPHIVAVTAEKPFRCKLTEVCFLVIITIDLLDTLSEHGRLLCQITHVVGRRPKSIELV